MANESINLNLIPTGEMPVIHVSQFDNGRAFNINLLKGSDEYNIPEGYTAELHCRKADRNIVTLATTTVSQNTLTFTTTTQLCACAGENLCEVAIKDSEDYLVGSLNFILQVERDPLQGGIESTSEIHDLEDQIEEITTEIVGENYYTKTETDTLLDAKANAADVYTKTQVDTALSSKANAADVYTKTQVDTALSSKANAADVYTKTQVDNALSEKANTADLATVATTGDYDDLTNKPTIPAAQVQSDYAQVDNTKVDYIKNKPDLSIYAKESDLILATGTENETPYQIRQAPSNIGNLALEKLVGLTVCFNQMVNTGDTSINTVSGHKYYTSINGTKSIIQGGSAISINDSSEDNVIDLTAMFGSEVADYLYTLESGTAGAGVSLFKSLFGADFYPYTANTLMSAKPTGKVIKDENDQTIETIVYSGNELRGLLKVGTNGLYADGDIDDGSGSTDIIYSIIDLGSIDWTYDSRLQRFVSDSELSDIGGDMYETNFYADVMTIYVNSTSTADKTFFVLNNKHIYIYNSAYNDASAFKTAMSGKYIVFKKATPTTATSTAWSNPIQARQGGTEEFTDSRTIKIPCGHDTIYSKKTNYRYWG